MLKKSLIVVGLLILCKSVIAGEWWDKDWQFRRKVDFARKDQRFKDSEGGRVLVDLQNRAFEDARDVRVTDENGNLLKHKIIWSDNGDLVQIICELGDKESAYVYWGNRKAVKQKNEYDPKFGLYLETWEKPEGNVNTWESVQKLFKDSKKIYGRSVHTQVQDRFNRFGPSDNYLSHYYGWLNCPEVGEYKFFTASDDASFLLIDDKVVVQWTGRHTAWSGLHGEYFGLVDLKKGKHRFDYYHVETSNDQACVAGWRLPSQIDEKLEEGETLLIPPRYFGGFVEGYAQSLEILAENVCADFRHVAVSDLYMTESDALVKVQFNANIFGEVKLAEGWDCSWDFGDGNSGKGKLISHVFLTSGIYTVSMNVVNKGKTLHTGRIKVKILPIWDMTSRFNEYSARYFWDQIKDYKLVNIEKAGLQNLYAVCDMLRNFDGKLQALRELTLCIAEFKDNEKHWIYLELAELEAYQAQSFDNCLKYLKLAEKFAQTEDTKTMTQIKQAELLFKVFDKTKEASEILQALENSIDKLSLYPKKEFYLVLGDFNRLSGNLDDARKNFESAMNVGNSNAPADTVKIADWRMKIGNCLRSKTYEAAISTVQDWRWNNPVSYLDHDLAYWEIKIYLEDGQSMKAEALAKILIKGQPDSVYVGDCLWELSEYFIKYKNSDKARTYLTILIENYKEHPKYKEAVKKIKTLK